MDTGRQLQVEASTLAHHLRSPEKDSLLAIQVDGSSALFHTVSGDFKQALALRQANADRTARNPRLGSERARTLGDLSDALRRSGRLEEAVAAAEEALDAVHDPGHRMADRASLDTERFLRLHHTRALAAVGRTEEALEAVAESELNDWPSVPRLLVQLEHAALRGDRARVEQLARAHEPEGGVRTILHHLLDRALALLGDAEAEARLKALPPFAGLDLDEIARRLPY